MPRDFLSGLIGRAFEQTPVLEKRRASMFEPERGHAGRESAWSESVDEASAPDRGQSGTPWCYDQAWKPQGQQPRVAEPSRAEDWSRNRLAETQPRVVSALQAAEEVRPALPEADRRSVSTVEQSPSPVRAERLIERHVETRQTVVEHRELQIERTRPAQPAKDYSPGPPRRREVIEIRKEAADVDQQDRSRSDTPLPRIEASQKAALQSVPAVRIPLRARPASNTPAPAQAPTIQVSIGRVELRSAQPAPPVKTSTPRARAPKLGLDDYLRRREGGVQ